MKTYLFAIALLSSIGQGWCQKDASSLAPAHRAALAAYLNRHKNCDFMPERAFNEEYAAISKDELKDVRSFMKGRMKHPYYMVGDFNHDGIPDFAVVLALSGKGDDHERIVVWNGTKGGGYRLAWEDDEAGGGFLSWTWESKKKRKLCYGAPESDTGFYLTPAGNSYIPGSDAP